MDAVTPLTQPDPGPSLFKKRQSKNTTIRKRPTTPPPASHSSSESSASDSGEGPSLKRRRKNGGVTASSHSAEHATSHNLSPTQHPASRSAHINSTNDATKQSNWFDDTSASALLGSTRSNPTAPPSSSSLTDTNPNPNTSTYKGATNYQTFISKNPNAPIRQVGPIKAPTNIRTITVTDFAPDVCKDYKQTGFCGFGDSCKFLHAREDYKQGWELDREWEVGSKTKGKKVGGGRTVASAGRGPKGPDGEGDDEEEEDTVLEGIPFACVLCKKAYKNPVVTRCGHYFCEACALQRYRRSPACAVCGAGTGGVFNGAKGLRRLLERKRERARRRRERAVENGEEVSGEEEGEEEQEGGVVG